MVLDNLLKNGQDPCPKLNNASEFTAYSQEHLTYEIEMITALANSLIPKQDDESKSQWAHRMASIESFGLHLRNLIEFFEPSANNKKGRNSDVIARDFLLSEMQLSISEKLEKARERANKNWHI